MKKVNLFDEVLTVSADVDCVIKMIKAGAKPNTVMKLFAIWKSMEFLIKNI